MATTRGGEEDEDDAYTSREGARERLGGNGSEKLKYFTVKLEEWTRMMAIEEE